MHAGRLQALGQASVVKRLRPILFDDILGAATVYPDGYTKVILAKLLGWLGPLLTVHSTDPLPATHLYVAVTPRDIRLFSKPAFSSPFEIDRWDNGSYRASISRRGPSLKLDLELERLGRIRLVSGLRMFASNVEPVFDLVVRSASGPVIEV